MQYRRLGFLAWKAFVLGFGARRLPWIGNDSKKIDGAKATKMLPYASVKERGDLEALLNEQREKVPVYHIDFYLLR